MTVETLNLEDPSQVGPVADAGRRAGRLLIHAGDGPLQTLEEEEEDRPQSVGSITQEAIASLNSDNSPRLWIRFKR